MIKAIIFDFDGTILDTETAWYEAFCHAYGEHGAELPLETFSQCIGTSLHAFNPYDFIHTLTRQPVDPAAFKKSVHDRHSELMERAEIRPGIRAFLEAAKDGGLKIGLASSSNRKWIDKYTRLLGIDSCFDCIRTSDDVQNVKPDPELYVRTLECLGVAPGEAVAIEDSPNGSLAAVAAGMHCVVVPNPITKPLAFDPSCLMAECLTDIDFKQLIEDPLLLVK